MAWAIAVMTGLLWAGGADAQQSGDGSRKSPVFARVVEDPPKNPGSWGIGGLGKLSPGKKKASGSIGLRPVRKKGQGDRLLGGEAEKAVPVASASEPVKSAGDVKNSAAGDKDKEMVFEVVEQKATGEVVLEASSNEPESVKTGEVVTGKVNLAPLIKPAKAAEPAVVSSDLAKTAPVVPAVKKTSSVSKVEDGAKDKKSSAPGFGGLGGGGGMNSTKTVTSGEKTALKRPGGAEKSDRLLKGESKTAVAEAKKAEATMPKSKVVASDIDTKPDSVVPAGVKTAPAVTMSAPEPKKAEGQAHAAGADVRGSGGAAPGEVVMMSNEDEATVRVVEGGDDTLLPTWEGGYFPTQDDTLYLGGFDYPRRYRNMRGAGGPDNPTQVGVGLFPYDVPGEPSSYDSLYRPINNVLGSFGRFDTYTMEGSRLQGFSMTGEANMPFFTRSFEPDKAHIKAGPVYLDFLFTGAGVLYSDYEGDRTFNDGEEDGGMGFVELAVRGYVKVTDQFYISLATRLIYLPGENRLGFALGDGDDLGVFFRANYEFEWKTWDFIVYDEFRGHTFPIFADLREEAIQRSGRYRFGINERDRRSRDFFDGDVYFTNTIGAKASTPFLQEDWRLWLEADHRDHWRSYDFDDHSYMDHLGVLVGYEGDDFPFAPYVRYDVRSYDRFKSLYHTSYIGGSGRLTENLNISGRAGYLWTTGREPEKDKPLWRVGLRHQLSEDTRQSLWGGQTFDTSDITNETALAEYIRYEIDHRFFSRLSGVAFVQLSKDEDLVAGTPVTDRERLGARLDYRLFDFTRVTGAAYHSRSSPEKAPAIVRKRWVYRAEWEQQIYSRTTARFFYQFEDSEGGQNFDEHLFSLSLRRYF